MQRGERHSNPDLRSYLPTWGWNVCTLFFGGWFLVAGWLLAGGSDEPILRFAFAFCGLLCLLAGRYGNVLHSLRSFYRSHLFWGKHVLPVVIVLAAIGAILRPVLIVAQSMARASSAYSILKKDGLSLIQYTQNHAGVLPPDTHRMAIGDYLRREGLTYWAETRPGVPVIWCGAVSGMRLTDFAHPEEVLVAYSSEPERTYGRAILYLDGHTKSVQEQKFAQILRTQPGWIQKAKKIQAERKLQLCEWFAPCEEP